MQHYATYRFVSQVATPQGEAQPALWFVFQGDKLITRPAHDSVEIPLARDLSELGLTPARRVYLGYLTGDDGGQTPCYAAEVDPTEALPGSFLADGLRGYYAQLGETFFHLAGRAIQLVNWDRTHQYCGQCGTPTVAMPNERAKQCPACGLTSYPRLSPATIVAVTADTPEGRRILLARNHRFPDGFYSVIAGFVEPGESLEECVAREVLEEVGVRVDNIRYFGSQPWPFPNSLMVGFTAEYVGGDIVLEAGEIADAIWCAADALPKIPPKMSIARRLIDWFVATNRSM
jgi:NAD+ diphosphatase